MVLCRFIQKQASEVLSPNGPLSSSFSPGISNDANAAVKQCADLSPQAATKPRGTYVKFTSENQAAIAKHAFLYGNKAAIHPVLLCNVNCVCAHVQAVRVQAKIFFCFILSWNFKSCENLHQRKYPALQ